MRHSRPSSACSSTNVPCGNGPPSTRPRTRTARPGATTRGRSRSRTAAATRMRTEAVRSRRGVVEPRAVARAGRPATGPAGGGQREAALRVGADLPRAASGGAPTRWVRPPTSISAPLIGLPAGSRRRPADRDPAAVGDAARGAADDPQQGACALAPAPLDAAAAPHAAPSAGTAARRRAARSGPCGRAPPCGCRRRPRRSTRSGVLAVASAGRASRSVAELGAVGQACALANSYGSGVRGSTSRQAVAAAANGCVSTGAAVDVGVDAVEPEAAVARVERQLAARTGWSLTGEPVAHATAAARGRPPAASGG